MYREMTAEEKLQFSAEMIEALQTGGFIACLELLEKYKEKLSVDNLIDKQKVETPPPIETKEEGVQNPNLVTGRDPQVASIYAPEHIGDVQADAMGNSESAVINKAKTLVLEESYSTPNPWTDAKKVVPGEVKEMLTR